ncbi:hypothetical protein HY798_03905 [Candidatus Falkowbacteria bacterium]|nr:hypothetical protein [Candidatus Falkowbacteria bacterium]
MELFENFIKRKKDKLIEMKDIGRRGYYFFRKDAVTFLPQHNTNEKYYIVERLRLVELKGKITNKNSRIGQVEYRMGYYIVGRIGRAKNKWTWGQFCPMIPTEDFNKLINKANRENTILK